MIKLVANRALISSFFKKTLMITRRKYSDILLKDRELEKYWSEKAEELGEPILIRSISHTYCRGIPDTFGIIYAYDSFLVYEYAKKSRKSILETLFTRRGGEELSESVRMERKDIRRAAIVNSPTARSWIHKSLSPQEVLSKLETIPSNPILNILAGTVVCVCTDTDYILLDTPSNRQWIQLLS